MDEIIKDIDTKTLASMIEKDQYPVLIDVRRMSEFMQVGVIKESRLLTFFDEYNNYDFEKWLIEFEKLVPTKDSEFILICAHANRTRTIGEYLAIKLGYTNVAHLAGGIVEWIYEGREVVIPNVS